MQHLPAAGPVVLATNCASLESSLQLIAVTDRATTVMLFDPVMDNAPLLRALALRRNFLVVSELDDPAAWQAARARVWTVLERGDMLAVGCNGQAPPARVEDLVHELCHRAAAPLVPVFCGPLDDARASIRVVFGPAISENATAKELISVIDGLGEWIKNNDDKAGAIDH